MKPTSIAIALLVVLAFSSRAVAEKQFSVTRTNSEGQRYTTTYYPNGTTFTKSSRR